ncbi:MAG TPA: hypothetical protein VFL81_01820 [Candidatus Saccharimonadales bacterium]|nr:hypothetical protein [Candidatus Saccharimonadales bacterium]
MLLVGFISWWYGLGWRDQLSLFGQRLARVADQWSIGSLSGSLFAPFRQLDTGRIKGPLGIQLRAMLDKLISRFIGAMVRSVVIVIGLLAFVLTILVGLLWLVIWPFLPVFPIIGFMLMAHGWLPWSSLHV